MNATFKSIAATIVASALGIVTLTPSVRAEDAAKPAYALVYFEVTPGKEKDAQRLILDHVTDAKRAAGALSIDAFARDGYPDQFALLEQWQSSNSRDDYASTPAARQFRTSLGKLESAGVDERIQGPLFVESEKPTAVSPITVMTHIDIIPTALEQGRGAIKKLVDSNRHQNNNQRFDVLVQTNRQNHMTLIEGWKRPADKNAERAAPSTISFRHDLLPMSGSPYDERSYHVLRD